MVTLEEMIIDSKTNIETALDKTDLMITIIIMVIIIETNLAKITIVITIITTIQITLTEIIILIETITSQKIVQWMKKELIKK